MWHTMFFSIICFGFQAHEQSIERLTVVTVERTIVAVQDGTPSSVALSAGVTEMLQQPDARLTIVHNHPISIGFSLNDLAQLVRPGVERIVVAAADGSCYEAVRGSSFDTKRFVDDAYRRVHDAVVRMNGEMPSGLVAERSYRANIAHLTSVALDKAAVIVYRTSLHGEAAVSARMYRAAFEHISDVAAAKIENAKR
jgi:hypothetical protein